MENCGGENIKKLKKEGASGEGDGRGDLWATKLLGCCEKGQAVTEVRAFQGDHTAQYICLNDRALVNMGL